MPCSVVGTFHAELTAAAHLFGCSHGHDRYARAGANYQRPGRQDQGPGRRPGAELPTGAANPTTYWNAMAPIFGASAFILTSAALAAGAGAPLTATTGESVSTSVLPLPV